MPKSNFTWNKPTEKDFSAIPEALGFKDLTGQNFGRLTVLGFSHFVIHGQKRKAKCFYWWCQCQCGKYGFVMGKSLRKGTTKSCGCIHTEQLRKRTMVHGTKVSGEKEYIIYCGMKARCYRKSNHAYARYGGKGVKICSRWLNGEEGLTGYQCFLADMGRCPKNYSIDRKDSNGDYSPDNCRWADDYTQAQNTKNNVHLEIGGEKHCIAEWARRTGIGKDTLYGRKKRGWSDFDCLSKPVAGTQNPICPNCGKPKTTKLGKKVQKSGLISLYFVCNSCKKHFTKVVN